ncbi:glutamate receptor-interacting protein 1 [Oopsacas minuta]|uniref:Glutamate receptor-interacting protein 1 n=1 Tax=Oopsacas minuta TaxID=111878 RepID=A0AAV7KK27_9METZ|nr:glutamate receptor-interacting protein 1 [Oopsacas minuta]
MLKLAGCFHPSTRLPDEKDLERKPSKKWSKKNKNKTNSRRNSDAQASTLDDVLLLRKEYSYIELIRENNQSLGIIFSGGVDQASPITIQEISPDSIAAKSEAVQVGDVIKAVNGIQTNQLKHEEVANILVNAGPVISLQLEFDSSQGPCGFEKSKITCLTLPKENYDYGFSLDGPEGAPLCDEFELRISHIYPCSTVYRLGLLKPGDKLLSINGISLKGASLRDATTLISEGREVASFEVEYPVAIHENLKSAKGPYTLELLRTPGSSLGLSLIGKFNQFVLLFIRESTVMWIS